MLVNRLRQWFSKRRKFRIVREEDVFSCGNRPIAKILAGSVRSYLGDRNSRASQIIRRKHKGFILTSNELRSYWLGTIIFERLGLGGRDLRLVFITNERPRPRDNFLLTETIYR